MKYNLIEQIFNDINNVIEEELGISENIVNISNEIYNDMLLKIKETEKICICNGGSKRIFTIRKPFLNKNLNIAFYYYNFKDKDFFNAYLNKIDDSTSSFLDNGRLIFITIKFYTISGNIIKSNVLDSMYHEMLHIYEQIMADKPYPNNDLYNFGKLNINSNNQLKKSLSFIFYLNDKGEQDAFANGLYGFLKNNFILNNVREHIEESDAYQMYLNLNKAINYIESSNAAELNTILKSLKLTKEKLLNIAYNAKKSFIRKIGRTIIKYKKDIINNNQIRTSFRPHPQNNNNNKNLYTI